MSIRLPDPIANTTTEAYLAYKAGVLAVDDLQPKLYEPYIHLDAWLAYWTGLVNTYPLDKNNDPEILTDEEAFIAYLSGVTNTYPQEFRDPADIRVAAYLRYLISARWGRPEYPVNNEELYLSMLKTKYIPSGDPSSDIVIDGTTKAPFVDVKLYGDTYQQTYTGKNLCGGTLAQIKNRNQSGTWNGNQYTKSGITWTVYENADGTIDRIEASGQATENGKTFYIKSFDRQQFEEQLGSEETYTLSGCPQGGDSGYYVRVASTPWKTMLTDRGSAATGTLVPADDYNNVFVVLCVDIPAGQVNNLVFRPQLEKGSIATSYEPYVGGQPSPSPEYPQQIQTVTGQQTVTVTGKNLFNKNTSTLGVLNGDGTIGFSNDYYTSDFIQVMPDTTYHKTQTTSARFKFYDINKTPISSEYDDIPSAGDAQSFTTPSSCYYIRFSYRYNTKDSIQIEKGSTATAYAPYSKHTYTIDLGDIKLNGLGDDGNGNPLYEDYIYQDEDEWKLHKKCKTLTLDGSENWQYSTNYNFFYAGNISDMAIPVNEGVACYCRTHKGLTSSSSGPDFATEASNYPYAVNVHTTQALARIKDTRFSSTQDLATWLAQNNTTIYYVVRSSTNTVITDQNLIDQLNALKQGGAEEGTTYIKVSATDPNLPAKLYVEAPKYD